MKYNFRNPKTGKPSSVVIADHWVAMFGAVAEAVPDGCDSVPDIISGAADAYFVGGFPRVPTFTQAVEYWIANRVRCAVGGLWYHAEKGGYSPACPPSARPKPENDNLSLPLD